MKDFDSKRLKHLEENINRQYNLQKEYERIKDLSERPKEVENSIREIKVISQSLLEYINEYEEICKQNEKPIPSNITNILNQILATQESIINEQKNTVNSINALREAIISEIDNKHKEITKDILLHLKNQQLKTIYDINKMLNKNLIENKNLMLESINDVMLEIQKREFANLNTSDIRAIKSALETNKSSLLGIDSKFKISIPIIPMLLNYETELSIDIKNSLKKIWSKMSSKN